MEIIQCRSTEDFKNNTPAAANLLITLLDLPNNVIKSGLAIVAEQVVVPAADPPKEIKSNAIVAEQVVAQAADPPQEITQDIVGRSNNAWLSQLVVSQIQITNSHGSLGGSNPPPADQGHHRPQCTSTSIRQVHDRSRPDPPDPKFSDIGFDKIHDRDTWEAAQSMFKALLRQPLYGTGRSDDALVTTPDNSTVSAWWESYC